MTESRDCMGLSEVNNATDTHFDARATLLKKYALDESSRLQKQLNKKKKDSDGFAFTVFFPKLIKSGATFLREICTQCRNV